MAPPPDNTTYRVKWVCDATGRSVPIALQGANGPCALLALLNVQFQNGNLTLPGGCAGVSEPRAMSMLAELAMRGTQSLQGPEAAARESAVQNLVELLPSLRSGMHVNVRFSSPTAFEFTKEIAAFDCFPDVRLVHGWLVDPQDRALADAFGSLSYNQVMDELVSLSTPADAPMLPPPVPPPLPPTAPPAHESADAPSTPTSPFVPWSPPATLTSEEALSEDVPVAPAAPDTTAPSVPAFSEPAMQFGASPGEEFGDIDIALPPHLQPCASVMSPVTENVATDAPSAPGESGAGSADGAAAALSTLCVSDDDNVSINVNGHSKSSACDDTVAVDSITKRDSSKSSAIARHAVSVMEFFNSFPTQLTYHGIVELHSLLRNGETCILFRNSHFYVLRKHDTDLYTLATDVGFEKEHDIAWELLRDVNGDSSFYSALFTPSVPERARAAAAAAAAAAAPAQSAPAHGAASSSSARPPRTTRPHQVRQPPRVAAAAPSRRKSERRDESCCLQ